MACAALAVRLRIASPNWARSNRIGAGVAGRRSKARSERGRVVGSRRPEGPVTRLHVVDTVVAAAPHQRSRGRTGPGLRLQRDDLRSLRFRVAGHTDAKGSDKANEELSRKRAASVVAYLRQGFGIEGGRLEAVGLGEKELMDWKNPNNSANRRVEVRTMN